jgi:TATA-box binding protein (TBP) (component of TFIID and TFIIIB)
MLSLSTRTGLKSASAHYGEIEPVDTATLSLTTEASSKKKDLSIRIVNVVMEADLGQAIDLERFGAYPWGQYNSSHPGAPASFKGAQIRAKVLITRKGKMIVSGTRSETEAKQAIIRAAELLVKEELTKSVPSEFRVLNVVAIGSLCCRIDLEVVASSLRGSVYDPQQFPAAMLQFGDDPSTHFSLFSNGKFVVMGPKSVGAAIHTARLFAEHVASIFESDRLSEGLNR